MITLSKSALNGQSHIKNTERSLSMHQAELKLQQLKTLNTSKLKKCKTTTRTYYVFKWTVVVHKVPSWNDCELPHPLYTCLPRPYRSAMCAWLDWWWHTRTLLSALWGWCMPSCRAGFLPWHCPFLLNMMPGQQGLWGPESVLWCRGRSRARTNWEYCQWQSLDLLQTPFAGLKTVEMQELLRHCSRSFWNGTLAHDAEEAFSPVVRKGNRLTNQ